MKIEYYDSIIEGNKFYHSFVISDYIELGEFKYNLKFTTDQNSDPALEPAHELVEYTDGDEDIIKSFFEYEETEEKFYHDFNDGEASAEILYEILIAEGMNPDQFFRLRDKAISMKQNLNFFVLPNLVESINNLNELEKIDTDQDIIRLKVPEGVNSVGYS